MDKGKKKATEMVDQPSDYEIEDQGSVASGLRPVNRRLTESQNSIGMESLRMMFDAMERRDDQREQCLRDEQRAREERMQ